ncbi:MAG TPA: hypothetical protein VLW75_03870, partial [Rhizomicrobium sp.]|nr:hypothetical protein [Rhizomicrobium sp.]
MDRYAILIDGGFIKKKLQAQHGHFPTVTEITAEVARIRAHAALEGLSLLRVFYYDAPPASGRLKNPVSGANLDLDAHPAHAPNLSLQQSLEMQPDFALRSGDTA